jgi:hypothetical protein
MLTKVLVLVADRDNPKHAEITVLDDRAEAERLFETLLEAGIAQEQIRIFSAAELQAQVTHHLVVALDGGDQQVPAAVEASPAEEAIEREETAREVGPGKEEEMGQDSSHPWFRSPPQGDPPPPPASH